MKNIYIVVVLLLFYSCSNPNRLVNRIANYGMVETERIEGWLGEKKSNQYKRYLKLSKRVDENTLLELRRHDNEIVRCYSGYALIDNEIRKPIEIFEPYIEDNSLVWHSNGIIFGQSQLSYLIYIRIWEKYLIYPDPNKVFDYELVDNPDLISLDSFILYNPKSPEKLVSKVLSNRMYPIEYNDRIMNLGMERLNYNALKYIKQNNLKVDSLRLEKILNKVLAIREEQNNKELKLIKEILSKTKN